MVPKAMNKKIFCPYKEIDIKEKTRLVIYDLISKEFIRKVVIERFDSIEILFTANENIYELKYKYQVFSDNSSWKDCSNYKYISKKNISELSDNFSFEVFNIESFSKLEELSDHQISIFFRNFLKKYYFFLLNSPTQVKVDKVIFLLNAIPDDLVQSNNVVAHCYSQILIMTDYVKKKLDGTLTSTSFDLEWYNNITEEYNLNRKELIGFLTGSLVAKGHIYSLFDRKETFECYSRALEVGKDYIEELLVVDPLSTYYPSILYKNSSYEIIRSDDEKTQRLLCDTSKNINVCFSTDLIYFKMFSIGWANASFYFENIILNFGIVTNNIKDYEFCVNSYKNIIEEIAKLLEVQIPNNYRFFWIKSSIVNKTLYACARFYLAKHLLSNFKGSVFISDIDQLVVGDLEKHLEKLEKDIYSVYQPIASGYFSMLPGRSHLAGNIFVRNNKDGKAYCDILTDYVGMGLEDKNSWILDQNATRFASELIKVTNFNSYGRRPLKQYPNFKKKLQSLWKK